MGEAVARLYPWRWSMTGHARDERQACWAVDPEIFFGVADSPEGRPAFRLERHALLVCASCPVKMDCLVDALQFPADEQYGVIGGKTAGQRRALLPVSRAQPTRSSVTETVTSTARPQELARIAAHFHQAGHSPVRIAHQLGVGDRRVYRWLARERAALPVTPSPGRCESRSNFLTDPAVTPPRTPAGSDSPTTAGNRGTRDDTGPVRGCRMRTDGEWDVAHQSAADVAVVALACTACQWVYQPDRAAFESGRTGCPRCGGWTWIAQLGTGQGDGR